MTNKLIPTPIVDKNGKQTTVHKKVAGSSPSGKLSNVVPVLPVPKKNSASTLDDVLGLFNEVDERLEYSLMSATPDQLRDVEDAMVIAREREARGLSPKRNSESLFLLVSGGAFTAVAKIAQNGTTMPNSSSMTSFGKREVAKEISWLVQTIIPMSNGLVKDNVDNMAKTPTHYLDAVRRGVEHAARLDGDQQSSALTVSNMLPFLNLHSMSEYSVIEAFDKHWSDLPHGMTVEGFRSVMIALGDGRRANGKYVEIAAHLRACALSTEHPYITAGHQREAGTPYFHNYRMRDVVEQHPDKVEAIIQWNKEGRGSDYYSDLFREYLSVGTLRDGQL